MVRRCRHHDVPLGVDHQPVDDRHLGAGLGKEYECGGGSSDIAATLVFFAQFEIIASSTMRAPLCGRRGARR